jgi:GNAT superfamily N-acetyltransferase
MAMEYLSVRMLRRGLEDIPEFALPGGYALRGFRPGDRETWLRVVRAAEPFMAIEPDLFDREFGGDLAAMRRRCFFLVGPDGADVGTITAWHHRRHLGRPWGRIHYVAIVPAHQGEGLSRPIMTAALKRLRALGHRRALLDTQTPRIAAIRTYLRFGFVPDMTRPDAAHAWGLIAEHVSHPALAKL